VEIIAVLVAVLGFRPVITRRFCRAVMSISFCLNPATARVIR
jgi:hypothetical protein